MITRSRLWVYAEAIIVALTMAAVVIGLLVALVALPAPRVILDGEQLTFGGPGETISWQRTWERVRPCPGQLHIEIAQGENVISLLDAEIFMHQPRVPSRCRAAVSDSVGVERYVCTWEQSVRVPENWRPGSATLRSWIDWDWWCLPPERRQIFPPMTLRIN